ncbi:hypothetical protein FB451DRAFT_1177805 [Mycena latifolia]|nr:hypothetical protein FB451DRAFT_1177805 [Mycena latifolia]
MPKRKRSERVEDPWWAFRALDLGPYIKLFEPKTLQKADLQHIFDLLSALLPFVVLAMYRVGAMHDSRKVLNWPSLRALMELCASKAVFILSKVPDPPQVEVLDPFAHAWDLSFLETPAPKKSKADPPPSASKTKTSPCLDQPIPCHHVREKPKGRRPQRRSSPPPRSAPPRVTHSKVTAPDPKPSASAKSKGKGREVVPPRAPSKSFSQLDAQDTDSDGSSAVAEPELKSTLNLFVDLYHVDASHTWQEINTGYHIIPPSGESGIEPAVLIIPDAMVFNGILPPGFQWAMLICTNCATRGAVCVYVGPRSACWACRASRIHGCTFSIHERVRMQTGERLEAFRSIQNPALVSYLARMIELRRRVDFAYSLLLADYDYYTAAVKDFAVHYFQSKSAVRPNDFEGRFENPETIDVLEQLFERLDITHQHARDHWLEQHPAPATFALPSQAHAPDASGFLPSDTSLGRRLAGAPTEPAQSLVGPLRGASPGQDSPSRPQRACPFCWRIQGAITFDEAGSSSPPRQPSPPPPTRVRPATVVLVPPMPPRSSASTSRREPQDSPSQLSAPCTAPPTSSRRSPDPLSLSVQPPTRAPAACRKPASTGSSNAARAPAFR